MKNRIFKILVIFLQISFFLTISTFSPPCLIKKHLNIECPGCGLTRAFEAILDLKFLDAIKYNILSIPLFLLIIFINILLVYDIIFNKNKTKNIINIVNKNYKIIILVLILATVMNNLI